MYNCCLNQIGASLITDGSFGKGVQYSFLDTITCSGDEDKLSDCSINVLEKCLPKCSNNIAIRCYSMLIYIQVTVSIVIVFLFVLL